MIYVVQVDCDVRIVFTRHARERMSRYDISEDEVVEALLSPDEVVPGHSGRLIAHKYRGRYVLRVVFEREDDIIKVITVYRARRERYERKSQI